MCATSHIHQGLGTAPERACVRWVLPGCPGYWLSKRATCAGATCAGATCAGGPHLGAETQKHRPTSRRAGVSPSSSRSGVDGSAPSRGRGQVPSVSEPGGRGQQGGQREAKANLISPGEALEGWTVLHISILLKFLNQHLLFLESLASVKLGAKTNTDVT